MLTRLTRIAIALTLPLVLATMPDSGWADSGRAPRIIGYAYPEHADPGPIPVAARCAPPAGVVKISGNVIARVNAERTARGLPPLRQSGRLAKVAQSHACDNAARNVYSHTGSDGSDLSIRLRRGGYKLRVAAENTALGFDTTDRLVSFWMNSPHHRANILNPSVTELGVGLAQGARPTWVLVLARPR